MYKILLHQYPQLIFLPVINVTCDVSADNPYQFFGQCPILPIVAYTERTVTNTENSYSIIRNGMLKIIVAIQQIIQNVNVIIKQMITINVPDFINSVNTIPIDLTDNLPRRNQKTELGWILVIGAWKLPKSK
jgi:hypothetical protein